MSEKNENAERRQPSVSALPVAEEEHGVLPEGDHRRIGREMELFEVSEMVGKGLPMFTPDGATVRRELERFIVDEELRRGYRHVYTPVLGRRELYEISGHWELYREMMYPSMRLNDDEYVLRPMTCPHHFMLYKARPRSYRELPVRYAEIAALFRKELSGALYGLIRIMQFHLADSHIICTPDQVHDEFAKALELIRYVMEVLGLSDLISYRLSLRDSESAKYVDDPEGWEWAESTIREIMARSGLEYTAEQGEAVFYGPKVDINVKNAGGKAETLFTVQLDIALQKRFSLKYIDSEGRERMPYVVHRSSVGCLERTVAFLLETTGGNLPPWLAPVHAVIVPVNDEHLGYARKVLEELQRAGLRGRIETRSMPLGKKLHEAKKLKAPFVCIAGGREAAAGMVQVVNRDTGGQKPLAVTAFAAAVEAQVRRRTLTAE